jgi:hypothetical protein
MKGGTISEESGTSNFWPEGGGGTSLSGRHNLNTGIVYAKLTHNFIGRPADFGRWIGEPKIGEYAQWHYFASVATQTLR